MKTLNLNLWKNVVKWPMLALMVTGLLMVDDSKAQTASSWIFDNTLSGTPGAHITAAAVTLGSSIVSGAFNSGVEYYGQDGWPTGAVDPNAYLQFGVAASAGYYLVLNTVTLSIRRSTTGTAAGSGPVSWSLRSSLDGYTTDLATGNNLTINYQTFTVTLPAAFQSVASALTFRLYGYSSVTTSGGSNRFVINNIAVKGQAMPGVLAQQSLILKAAPAAGIVDLQWQTQGFAEGTDFIVERSVDGADFTAIGQPIGAGTPIEAGTAGSTAADGAAYQYQDASLPSVSTVYYRIQAKQPDGNSTWSAIEVVALQEAAGGSAIRSVVPEGGSLKTLLHLAKAGTYQLNIWSADGKILRRQMIQEQTGDQAADLSFGTHPHGIYILTLTGAGERNSREFVY
jgi:hypothetical protein